jgi:hypothetical protein
MIDIPRDHPHRARDVRGRPGLGYKADRAACAHGGGGDPAGSRHQQDLDPGGHEMQALADLRARLLADEQVDQRDLRRKALRQLDRLRTAAGRE